VRAIEQLVAEGRAKPKRRRRDRFAPVLTALLEDLWSNVRGKNPRREPTMAGDIQVLRLAREDLRRLRAVARAAYLQTDAHHVARPCDCHVCKAVWKHLVDPRAAGGSR
jgi:hypothetical protein